MSEYKVKLAAALPKADANGFDDYASVGPLATSGITGRSIQPRVALLVYDVKKVEVDPDGVTTVHLRQRRVQPVLTDAGRRLAEQMLADEYANQTGQAMLPYDLSALSKSAFADLPRSIEEIDKTEADEQDTMSPTDELRRHLERVHGTQEAHLLTAEAAEEQHRADHDGGVLGPLEHDRDWIGWTRADLEAAEFESDGLDPTETDAGESSDDPSFGGIPSGISNPEAADVASGPTDVVCAEQSTQADMDTVPALFSDGGR
jgi:hypothetical protein